jgi:XTP/dITP diphosphohydrolase
VTLYCATTNAGKLREFRLAATDDIAILPLPDLAAIPSCDETGTTFEENAEQKARHYGAYCQGYLFAEDSGLVVDALGGAPGVHSARFAGAGASDADNNTLLLERLRGVQDRAARYVCAIALSYNGQLLQTFHGEVRGRILDQARGTQGFGYDPLFYFEPFECTFAEAAPERKQTVSHRGEAVKRMVAYCRRALVGRRTTNANTLCEGFD